jgi:hypothetical protein
VEKGTVVERKTTGGEWPITPVQQRTGLPCPVQACPPPKKYLVFFLPTNSRIGGSQVSERSPPLLLLLLQTRRLAFCANASLSWACLYYSETTTEHTTHSLLFLLASLPPLPPSLSPPSSVPRPPAAMASRSGSDPPSLLPTLTPHSVPAADPLYPELWRACAGPLVDVPRPGDRVFYFPQGHIEQVG